MNESDSTDYILTTVYTSWHKVKKEQSNKAKAKEKKLPKIECRG